MVECIGKGKTHKPYEFGVKVSIATTNARDPGGQFVVHANALPGNPYDVHTPAARSGGFMSTKAIAATTHPTPSGSTAPASSAVSMT